MCSNVTMIFVLGRFLRDRANDRHEVKSSTLEKKREGGGEKAISHRPYECVVYIATYT